MLTQTSTGLIARYYNEMASQPDVAKACDVTEEILTHDFIFHPPNDREGQHGAGRRKQFMVGHDADAPDEDFNNADNVGGSSRGAGPCARRGTPRGQVP